MSASTELAQLAQRVARMEDALWQIHSIADREDHAVFGLIRRKVSEAL